MTLAFTTLLVPTQLKAAIKKIRVMEELPRNAESTISVTNFGRYTKIFVKKVNTSPNFPSKDDKVPMTTPKIRANTELDNPMTIVSFAP